MAKLKPSAAKKARYTRYKTENRKAKNAEKRLARHCKNHPNWRAGESVGGPVPQKETGYIITGTDAKRRPVFELVGFDRPNGFYSNAAKKARPDFSIGARVFLKVA